MTVRVREARTSAELDAVFRLRHQVFVEEEQYMPARHDRRLADRFDAYPTSANIVALVDGRIVGSIRFMERSAAGLSTDEFYDFTEQFAPAARDGCSGMLVVARKYRSTPRLVVSMMAMGYLWAASRGLTRLFGAINPERLAAFRTTGYLQVAAQFHHVERKLDVIPMVLEMSSIGPPFAQFIRRHTTADAPCPVALDDLDLAVIQSDSVTDRVGHFS
ncbi:MAG: acyl-homoserine-lactone synthase [Ilumatobacteraceae bacterium]